jgi:hypothetical protein
VSPEGVVLYAHYNRDSADHPDLDEMIEAVRGYAPTA